MIKTQITLPVSAGLFDCLQTAINSGADAIYIKDLKAFLINSTQKKTLLFH
jgi:hypothetical protein